MNPHETHTLARPRPHGDATPPVMTAALRLKIRDGGRRTRFAVAAAVILASIPGLGQPRGFAAAAESDGATSHHRFEDVEYWSRVFDDPKRDEWQQPDRVVRALALRPGMSVADIGAGTGYFSNRLSTAVGPTGAVFVVEVEPNLVARLRDRADQEGTSNLVPVLGSQDNPRLPPASVDLALFVDAYHHVNKRRAYLAILGRSLRPGARVAILEWKAGQRPVGPKAEDHKIPREQVEREMTEAGFESLPITDLLPHQHLLLFRRRATPDDPR